MPHLRGLRAATPEQLHLPACEHKARSAPPSVRLCHGSLAFSTKDLLALERASQVMMLPEAQLKRALPYASSGQAEAVLSCCQAAAAGAMACKSLAYAMSPAVVMGVHMLDSPEGRPPASKAVPGPQAPAQALDCVLLQQPLSS